MAIRLGDLRGDEFVEIGSLRVDSGQIMLSDPCYVLDDDSEKTIKNYKDVLSSYGDDSSQHIVEPWQKDEALVVSRFGGDGTFKVYMRKVDGYTAQIMID